MESRSFMEIFLVIENDRDDTIVSAGIYTGSGVEVDRKCQVLKGNLPRLWEEKVASQTERAA